MPPQSLDRTALTRSSMARPSGSLGDVILSTSSVAAKHRMQSTMSADFQFSAARRT